MRPSFIRDRTPSSLIITISTTRSRAAPCSFLPALAIGDGGCSCTSLALHVRDIDLYHTHEDKSAYNHGLFWHTCHYVDAAMSTHRTYPPQTRGVPGGGPSGGQNYASGLMLHYFLTGDPLSRESAIELAQWTLDMDDGQQTIYRWLGSRSYQHRTCYFIGIVALSRTRTRPG